MVGPSPAVTTVRSAQIIDLAARTVLVVAVMSNGVVEKRTLDLPVDTSPALVAEASERLARRAVGRTLAEVEDCDEGEDPLLAAAVRALREARAHHEVFVGGTSKLAAAFDAVGQLSAVLMLLEQQVVVVTLMRTVLDRGNRVAIGEETGLPSLADCALVLAPYSAEGTDGGHHRRARPHPHGLPAGAVGGCRGEPAARLGPGRRLRWPTAARALCGALRSCRFRPWATAEMADRGESALRGVSAAGGFRP